LLVAIAISGCAFWRMPEQMGQFKDDGPTDGEVACARRLIEEEPAWCPENSNNCVRPAITDEEWTAALARCRAKGGAR
jgi:hypothetical protein